jgi:hypothetical protein
VKFATLFDPFEERFMRFTSHVRDRRLRALTTGTGRRPHRAVGFDRVSGSEVGDFVWTTLVTPRIVGPRVIDVLRREEATGWDTYPVRLRCEGGPDIVDCVGLAVLGRGDATRKTDEELVNGAWPEIDIAAWDGSDVFMAPGMAYVFVTDRLADAFREAGLTNVEVRPVDVLAQ